MELLTLLASVFLAMSFLSASCASDQVNGQKSLEQYGDSEVHQARFTLPRKLKLQQDAQVVIKNSVDKDIMAHKKLMEATSGNKKNKKEENVVHARRGTYREWIEIEGPNKSEYFTMDYHWVRRRRPIHNKHIPSLP